MCNVQQQQQKKDVLTSAVPVCSSSTITPGLSQEKIERASLSP